MINGLTQIDEYLAKAGVNGEICIFGGACMCLAFSARVSTKDVDAVFQPAAKIRKAIFEVGVANGWDWNWVNDDVAGFLSDREKTFTEVKNLPTLKHLKVLFPSAEYMLAMKCLAARSGDDDDPSPDISDALWLCRNLNLTTVEGIQTVVAKFYPDEALSQGTGFFIEELVSLLV